MKSNTLLLDGGIAGGLLFALIVVWILGWLTAPGETVGPKADFKVTRGSPTAAPRKALRLGVSEPKYDDIGKLLFELGEGYKNYDKLSLADLHNSQKLHEYDVIFLTCAVPKSGGDILLKTALREFVEQKGGTLYASDLRFAALREAFPEFIDNQADKPGLQEQNVKATVHDPGLATVLEKQVVDLFFEAGNWEPAAFWRDKVKVYMTGDYQPVKGPKVLDAPLLVQFNVGKGTVIFTSFHNAQQGKLAEKLIKYLVFSAVTAKASAEMNRKIEKGGLSPAKSSLISASAENPKVTHQYTSKKAGKLLFALAFNPEGSLKLRLTVKMPDGKIARQEDTVPFTIELERAPAGEYEYTVEALNLPYPNFPFEVTVAEPK